MIQFQSVTKRYQQVTALKDLSFEVPAGKVFGYIGPNGAGKTTTIKILTGLIRKYQGSVFVGGQDARAQNGDARRLIGYLPQDTGFQEWRTVYHALHTFALLSGIERGKADLRIREVLEVADLLEHRNRKIVHLSGGTVQKLRFAQAVLHRPKILVLDEPLSGLDPSSRYRMKQAIRDFAVQDRVVFLSSHILSDVEDIADTIGILSGGSIRKIGTPAELRDEFDVGNSIEVELKKDADLERIFEGLDFITSIRRGDANVFQLDIDRRTDLDEAIRAILGKLVSGRIDVRAFRDVRPSLEDIYLSLTEE